MLIKRINYVSEFLLWVLLLGITFSNAAVEICIALIILLFLFKKLALKEPLRFKVPLTIIIYLFCAIIFISFLRSAHHKESLRGVVRIIKYALLYFGLVDLLSGDEKRLKRAFWVIIGSLGFTFLNGIFQDIWGFDFLRHRQVDKLDYLHRISASFVHPNDFGAYIISFLPLAFVFLNQEISRKKRILLFIVFILGAYCLLKTSSRGAWLGFLIGASIYFLIFKKKIEIYIPILIVLFILIFPHGFSRIGSFFKFENNTVWERVQLWKGTWSMIKEHPILGFGINTFSDYFPKYKPLDYPDLRYAHNSYLQMWSEIGIIGLGTFLLIIFGILKIGFFRITAKLKSGFNGLVLLGVLTGYVSFLIQSGFDTNLHSLVLLTQFWIMNAYIVSLNQAIEKER